MNSLLIKLEQARKILQQDKKICFTCDIDWASEYAIEQTLDYFDRQSIPITLFVTHPSDVIAKALKSGKIRAGLHPNFMPQSSQGSDFDEIINYCFHIVPDAISFRSHRYFDVNDIMEKFSAKGIKFDSNVCTLLDSADPFLHRNGIVRFPIFFEDGAYLYQFNKLDFSDIRDKLLKPGLKVINIHPMHLMLNTPYFKYTREIKDQLSREQWNNLGKLEIDDLRYNGYGISNVIQDMVDLVKESNLEMLYLEDAYDWICSL